MNTRTMYGISTMMALAAPYMGIYAPRKAPPRSQGTLTAEDAKAMAEHAKRSRKGTRKKYRKGKGK